MIARTSRWALPLLAGAVTLLTLYAAAWVTMPTSRALRSDFVNAYMGGQMLRAGQGGQIYDLALQTPIYATLTAPFHYPLLAFYDTPSAALMAAPFTILPLIVAWRAFSLVQLALVAASAIIAVREGPWPARTPRMVLVTAVAIGVAGYPTYVLFLQGQWSGLFALGAALGYRELRRGNPAWAAFWLLAPTLAVKPNLGLGLLAFMVGWGGRRVFRGIAATGAVVLGASLIVGGPGILGAFVHAGVSSRSIWPLGTMDGVTGITGQLLGSSDGADLLGFAACLLVAAAAVPLGRLARRPDRLEPALAGAVAITLLASPHVYPHDLVILTPAMVWLMAWAYPSISAGGATAMGRRFAPVAAWIVFCVINDIDVKTAGPRLEPWALLAGCIALAATTGMSARAGPRAGLPMRPSTRSPLLLRASDDSGS